MLPSVTAGLLASRDINCVAMNTFAHEPSNHPIIVWSCDYNFSPGNLPYIQFILLILFREIAHMGKERCTRSQGRHFGRSSIGDKFVTGRCTC